MTGTIAESARRYAVRGTTPQNAHRDYLADPLGFAAGDTNVSRYVGNGPTNATDPSGLQPPPAQNAAPKAFPNDFGQWKRNDSVKNMKPSSAENGVSGQFKSEMGDVMTKQIPAKILKLLTDNDVKIYLCTSPRSDFETRGGCYRPLEGVLLLNERMADGRPNPNAARNARHEFGHAFDHYLNESVKKEFLDAYRTDLRANPNAFRNADINYYIPNPQKTEADAAREAFAEAFADVTRPQNEQDGPRAAFFRETFRATTARVNAIVEQYKDKAPGQPQR